MDDNIRTRMEWERRVFMRNVCWMDGGQRCAARVNEATLHKETCGDPKLLWLLSAGDLAKEGSSGRLSGGKGRESVALKETSLKRE